MGRSENYSRGLRKSMKCQLFCWSPDVVSGKPLANAEEKIHTIDGCTCVTVPPFATLLTVTN
jgi:hypothetical protein